MDRHGITSWCPVSLMGVTAGSVLKWCETTTKRDEEPSCNATKTILIWKGTYHYTYSSNSSRLRSWFPPGTRTEGKSSKRDQTTCHYCMPASALTPRFNFGWDVITPRWNRNGWPNIYKISSIYYRPERSQNKCEFCYTLDLKSMGGLCAMLGTSSQDVAHPISSSLPDPHGMQAKQSPGRATSSPEELNTKTQKPHNATFMFERALYTSL